MKKPKQTMKAPDMFRKSFQTFDKKTGEGLSYLDNLALEFEGQPEPEPLMDLKDVFEQQLTLNL